MSAWKPAGNPSMSPYLICKRGNFAVAHRHVAGNGDGADEWRSGLISVPAKPPLARALFSSQMEHSLSPDVLPTEMGFREERDSHRSRSGGVTPACRGTLRQDR
jgi:hypothetical protein